MARLRTLITTLAMAAVVAVPVPAGAAAAAPPAVVPSAWGDNTYGQLGSGTNTSSNAPVQVSGLTGAVVVAGGYYHTLALRSDRTVWAWGDNYYGQLGDGTNTPSTIPVRVSGLTGAVAVAGGAYHSLALKADGTVWAWGFNGSGQLGNGTNTDSNVPVQVTGLTEVVAVAGGGFHSLAVKADGTVWAWGSNYHGQLGNGSEIWSSTPVQVSGLTGAMAVAGGSFHSLAVKADGTAWAWGANYYGQLGNGTNTDSGRPVRVSGLTGVVAVGAGASAHSLAVKADGTVWAWGGNYYGQLGNGTNTDSSRPVQVSGLTAAVAVAGGFGHSLAEKTDGTVWAWGYNGSGQLGNGTNTDSNVPVQVGGLTGAVAVAGGYFHSLAIGKAPTVPVITSVSPTKGRVGTDVAITGDNLKHATSASFGGVEAPFTVISDTEVHTRVPDGALTGAITLITPMGSTTTPFVFEVPPKINRFAPTHGPPGTVVTITGSAFTGATRVTFNGISASFTVDGYHRITATVPPGATTGPILVRTAAGLKDKSGPYFVVT